MLLLSKMNSFVKNFSKLSCLTILMDHRPVSYKIKAFLMAILWILLLSRILITVLLPHLSNKIIKILLIFQTFKGKKSKYSKVMIFQRILKFKMFYKTHFSIKNQDRFEIADQICWMVPQLHHLLKEEILIIVKTLILTIKLKKQIQTSSTQLLSINII